MTPEDVLVPCSDKSRHLYRSLLYDIARCRQTLRDAVFYDKHVCIISYLSDEDLSIIDSFDGRLASVEESLSFLLEKRDSAYFKKKEEGAS